MSKIIGFQQVSGTSKEGRSYSGVRIYVTEERNNVNGLACDDVYVGNQFLNGQSFSIGDEVRFIYNKFGRVEGIEKVKDGAANG